MIILTDSTAEIKGDKITIMSEIAGLLRILYEDNYFTEKDILEITEFSTMTKKELKQKESKAKKSKEELDDILKNILKNL